MSSIGHKLAKFYTTLKPPTGLPKGVGVLHPQKDPAVKKVTQQFFTKFYSDNHPRNVMIGINPGRFGAGITGINFTAPRQLSEYCGIDHPFGNSSELSAEFIYSVINRYGGAAKFYSHFFIGSMSPLGYIKDGKNLNYYDDRKLQESLTPFINDCLGKQLSFGLATHHCICIGGEKNYRFLNQLNEKREKEGLSHFSNITAVAHRRFILQYRRKQVEKYIDEYLQILDAVAAK